MSDEKNKTKIVGLKAEIQLGHLPIGTIVPYAAPVDKESRAILARSGWLFCDGSPMSRKTYEKLFKVIGDIHGRGDAVDTFNLPNYQGCFLRGVDHGRGLDPDAKIRYEAAPGGLVGDDVGSMQEDQFKDHVHSLPRQVWAFGGTGSNQAPTDPHGGAGVTETNPAAGGHETRPVNVYVNYLIFAGSIG